MFFHKKKPEPPIILEKISYWNGHCPVCKTHIGIDVHKHPVTNKETAACPHCGAEIWERVKK
jgi:hypothetical protein